MSSASAAQSISRLRVPETARIVNWPLRYSGPQVWLAGLGIVGCGVVAGMVSGNTTMGFICFAALLGSCWRLWVPVTFELGSNGVIQSTLFFRWRTPWRCFARFETRPQGVWLLVDTEPTAFSTVRGVYVRWADQEERVRAVLEFFLAGRRQRASNTTRTFVS